jgi:hypothetical protein
MKLMQRSIVKILGFSLVLGVAHGLTTELQTGEVQVQVPVGRTPMERALWLSSARPYTTEGMAMASVRGYHPDPRATYDAELAKLGGESEAHASGAVADPVAKRIVEIARARLHSPEAFQSVFSKWIYHRDDTRAQDALPLTPDLARPDMRLVWEDLLLGPRPTGSAPGIEERALQALGSIGDTRSLVVLEHRLLTTTRDEVDPERVDSEQSQFLLALLQFPGDAGIVTLMRFVDAALPSRPAGDPPSAAVGLDVRAVALELFSGASRGGIGASWKRAIQRFDPGAEASPEVLGFLADLRLRASSMPVISD